MKILILFLGIFAAATASAACKVVWVDHDYNSFTPAVKRQVCDNTLDLPALNNPGLQPLQQPGLKPLEPLALPPLGTSRCSTQQVWNERTMRWEQKRLCQ